MTKTLTATVLHKADEFLDTEKQHDAATELGKLFFATFGAEKEGRISTQVRNLQQMAVTATRFADIEDFVKNQMGRKAGAYREWRAVGKETLDQLKELRRAAEGLTKDEGERLLVRLHLARAWARAVVGAYLYGKAMKEMEQSHV
jgi:hypothetical protein